MISYLAERLLELPYHLYLTIGLVLLTILIYRKWDLGFYCCETGRFAPLLLVVAMEGMARTMERVLGADNPDMAKLLYQVLAILEGAALFYSLYCIFRIRKISWAKKLRTAICGFLIVFSGFLLWCYLIEGVLFTLMVLMGIALLVFFWMESAFFSDD